MYLSFQCEGVVKRVHNSKQKQINYDKYLCAKKREEEENSKQLC